MRAQHLEPPATERVRRLLRTAVGQREQQLVTQAVAQLSPATRTALDALVNTHAPEEAADADQMLLFPVRSELAAVKDGAGAVSVETVLDEIAKLTATARAGPARGALPRRACHARDALPAARRERTAP